MPDEPRDPIERAIIGLIRRERLANTLSVEALAEVERFFEKVIRELRRSDPTAPGAQRYRRLRQDKLLLEIERMARELSPALERTVKDLLAPIGRLEALRTHTDLVASLGPVGGKAVAITPVTQARIRTILNTEPFQGRVLKEHTDRIAANAYDATRSAIRQGMAAEESIGDIVRRVRGRQAGYIRQDPKTGAFVAKGTPGAIVRPRFKGGVLSMSTREAESLVRTAVTHVSAMGQLETYRENGDIIKAVQFLATLDDRTTVICLSLDGKEWEVDATDIVVPGRDTHYGCRSTLISIMDWEGLGLPAPPAATRSARDMSTVSDEDLRRKVSARRRTGGFGQVEKLPGGTIAEDWLRRQRPEVQERALGKGKAKLFREGKISLRDIVRDDFTTVPLSELRGAG